MLTQSLATVLQSIDGLFDGGQREILRSERNHGPQAAGSRTEELPSHDVPCTMRPRLLSNVRLFFNKYQYKLNSPSLLAPTGRRRTPGTEYREVEATEQEFPSDEGQLAYQSGRKTASSCSRGTATKSAIRPLLRKRMLTSPLTPFSIASIRSRGFLVTCCSTSDIISGMSNFLNICPPTMVQISAGTIVFC